VTKQAWSRRTRSIIGGDQRLFPRTRCLCPACAHLMRTARVHATMMHVVPLAAAAPSCALYNHRQKGTTAL